MRRRTIFALAVLASTAWTPVAWAKPFPPVIKLASLDGSTGFRLDGVELNGNSSQSVASAGDINGDGFADLVVGAEEETANNKDGAGSSYVVFGKTSGFAAKLKLSVGDGGLDGTNGFQINGVAAFDSSGFSVASAGDVNDDGFADLIIGAPVAHSFVGSSYVVFGKTSKFSPKLKLSSLDGSNGFRLDGVGESGWSVAGAGDINDDGFADLTIGAPFADPGGNSDAGSSYLVFGKASMFPPKLKLSSLDGSNGFRLNGVASVDYSGWSVASAGDINGDGFADLLVGAPDAAPDGKDDAGASYVVFGKASGFPPKLELSSLDGSNGFRVDGAASYDRSGSSLASAGDVNGDGFADLIIGAPSAAAGGKSAAGSSYVVFGKASGFAPKLKLSSLDGSNGFRLDGVSAGDLSGRSVASAGDVNGDGFADLIVGAYGADPGGKDSAGSSYVVFGKASGFAPKLRLSSLDGSNGFRLDGVFAGDHSGFSVASAGDVNDDGFADLIIGAPLADPAGKYDAGSSYVVFGRSP